jgi:hypothetical protein
MSSIVAYEQDGVVVTLTLSEPETRNALIANVGTHLAMAASEQAPCSTRRISPRP